MANNLGFGVNITSTFRPIFNSSPSSNSSSSYSSNNYSGYNSSNLYPRAYSTNNYYHNNNNNNDLLMYPLLYSAMNNNQTANHNAAIQADAAKSHLKEQKKDAIYLSKSPESEGNIDKKVKKNALVLGSTVTAISGVLMPFLVNTFEIKNGVLKELSLANLSLALFISSVLGGVTALCCLAGKQNLIRGERIKYEVENGDIKLQSEKEQADKIAKPQNINVNLNVTESQKD